VLSFLGVIIVALLAGVFPVLLLVAARRRGELLTWGYRVPAQGWVLGVVYAIALGGVLLHGLVIWDDPLQRAAAFAVTALALVMTASMVRDGAFAPRATVQLRHEVATDSGSFALVLAGRRAPATVTLEYDDGTPSAPTEDGEIARFSALRSVRFTPDWNAAGGAAPAQLKVWAHRITAEEDSEPLTVTLEIERGASREPVVLDPAGCARLAPEPEAADAIVLRLERDPAAALSFGPLR
jgi:hypothetical protein